MPASPPITAADIDKFILDSGAQAVVEKLKAELQKRKTEGRPFIVSDVYDSKGNQYVDLVQEGGGVWGVALLGFTYVMEEVGIRFFSLAGTSAGAINTMLMAATKNKEDAKTKTIIGKFLALDLFSLVDGKKENGPFTKWVKKVIQKFVFKKERYLKRLKAMTLAILLTVSIASVATFISAIFLGSALLFILAVISFAAWIALVFMILFFRSKIKQLVKTGYGLNEGNSFRGWLIDRLAEENIHTLEDLKTHFTKFPADLVLRPDEKRDIEHAAEEKKPGTPDKPMLTIIASDLTTGNKIEFPRMWDLYWANRHDVNPADFVRASMSIPVFYETFKIAVSPAIENPASKWKDHINWDGYIPKQVQFVDGGVLSNFPINVFFNPDFIIPRMPTVGIRLSGGVGQSSSELKTIGEYVNSLVSTLRGNADKDFINKNKAFKLGIKEVPLEGHSWLNFFMEPDEKRMIFLKGAEMAAEFLAGFNWEDYKEQRLANQGILQEQRMDPNNWEG